MKFALLILLAVCMAVASACQPAEITTAEAETTGGIIRWLRDPNYILFRAEVRDGQDSPRSQGEVPPCTVYGDNHVVWTNELGAFQTEVLHDRLPDEAIVQFVDYLTVAERIFTYSARAITELPGTASPVVETVALQVNDTLHTADAFSGWDRDWYSRVLAACRSLSQTPTLYVPEGAWLWVEPAEFSAQFPAVLWNAEVTGVSLASTADAGQPVWVTGENAAVLWNYVRSQPPTLLLGEGSRYFNFALQVPGISRGSPPAPPPAS